MECTNCRVIKIIHTNEVLYASEWLWSKARKKRMKERVEQHTLWAAFYVILLYVDAMENWNYGSGILVFSSNSTLTSSLGKRLIKYRMMSNNSFFLFFSQFRIFFSQKLILNNSAMASGPLTRWSACNSIPYFKRILIQSISQSKSLIPNSSIGKLKNKLLQTQVKRRKWSARDWNECVP